ncbi:hypothetical protein CQA53_02090 [Helicobacter didelphidarum]|uniref:Beta-lactamase n=1 Tax=Helicobacter didelphidarum TaxID=2040648 RepID=A0A3D8IPC7_9HELI|nr:hypothetical protein [Helicobacter didelphidarum]RDU67072.1 hypothetical protein CQA53_02090 [Helicobacter didelphidarum]
MMQIRKIYRAMVGLIVSINFVIAVPPHIESSYNQVCWDCYTPEISIQNFLNKHRETLRNLCFKKDADACLMMAQSYAAIGNGFDAQDYWQRACKLGKKEACPMVEEDE